MDRYNLAGMPIDEQIWLLCGSLYRPQAPHKISLAI